LDEWSQLKAKGIVHGDIKPENVLIFRESTGRYIAKVTDFGYSTRFATENDDIPMPRSWPWTAPEWRYRCKPEQARKMDVYSFGLLCFWTMFESILSGVKSLPENASWAKRYLQSKSREDHNKVTLANLKNENKLIDLAQLLATDIGLHGDKADGLLKFFGKSLQCSPKERFEDISEAIKCLSSDR
jgi:serine/threonine protein kinase